ncbi:MAG TPA: hypothetical protein VGH28_17635 [Polyangiaceae bacterium]|jgi:hypothetical protein
MKSLRLLACFGALFVCFASRSARADDQPTPVVDHGPRFRFGVSATAGLIGQQQTYDNETQWQSNIAVPGLAVRAGVQLDDRYAVFYQLSGSIFLPTLRNAAMFEVTPVRWFSVGAGASVNYFNPLDYDASDAWSLGVPVRLAVNVPFHISPTSGRRLGMSFNVEVTPAYSFGGPGLPAGFQLGSVAGVGFEMF